MGYLSETAFIGRTIYEIVIGCVLIWIMVYCAQRQPKSNTPSWNIVKVVLGGIIITLGVLMFFAPRPERFQHLLYNYSVFGTQNPSSAMLEYGIGPNTNIYMTGSPIWSNPSFEQFKILAAVRNGFSTIALGLYILLYKKSNTTIWAKIRTSLGYIFLLEFVPISMNFHYFKPNELISACVTCGITYMLIHHYNKDIKEPKNSINDPIYIRDSESNINH